ncbi:helix-turn-helix domain-containing protein [Kitasatospora sp. NPDC097643]|uniref:TetR/AcrR family transcriptional regulator n=1 Tax=Kitasatospora sp. NPDC097643 TaxID=3157230 RepID=UPI00331FDC5B
MPHQPTTTTQAAKPLRRDAQRNRDALLAAARGAFAEEGLDASLEGIARQAGVAIGTLYRHFPTRVALVEELFAEKFQEWLTAGEQALAMDDAWQGFCSYLEKFCELQARDRAFNDLASMRLPTEALTEQVRHRTYDLACEIFARAQEQGSLRADSTPEDLAFLIWSQARIIQATRTVAPNAWRRHLGLMLDAFRADKALPLSEPPMTPDEVSRAMTTLGGSCTG